MFILYAAVKLVTALCNCKEIKNCWNCSQRPIMIITRVCVNKKWFSISTHYFIDKKEASAIITANLNYFLSIVVSIWWIAYENMHKYEMEKHKLPHSVFSWSSKTITLNVYVWISRYSYLWIVFIILFLELYPLRSIIFCWWDIYYCIDVQLCFA